MTYDVKHITQLLKSRLNERRFYHSMCVADAAQEIAGIYGVSSESAYFAGLVHDIMRNETEENMREYIKQNNIILTQLELNSSVLWHAILGAHYIEHVLGVDDADIINAVRYHTTGRAGMSPLEQVLFLADCSSADRNYHNVQDIRDLIRSNINRAMYEVLDFTVNDLKSKKSPVHPDTLAAYDEFIGFKC